MDTKPKEARVLVLSQRCNGGLRLVGWVRVCVCVYIYREGSRSAKIVFLMGVEPLMMNVGNHSPNNAESYPR
jgi:hypothetical protein